MTKIKDNLKARLVELNIELRERKVALQDKIDVDIEYYGKPIGKYTVLMKKIAATERKMVKHEERIRKAWMTKRDTNILNNILHEKDSRLHTSVNKSRYDVDNRYSGSYNSRHTARTMEKRGKKNE
mgnify:CR=1 FL=1|tara:strand:+ start:7133 stop:7510 length:378 start_codon:yes stop_codon:yes gene_type:complete